MIEKKRKTELDIDSTVQPPEAEAPPPPPPPPKEPEPAPADATAPETETETETVKSKPSRRKLFIIAGVSSAVVVLAAVSLAVYFGGTKEKVEPKIEEKTVEVAAAAAPIVPIRKLNNIPLKPFLLPVMDNNRKGFLRVKFSLLLSNADAVGEVEENLSLMRETIYQFAKLRDLDDFKPTGKRDETIRTLRRLLDRSLQNGRVEDVMITEFTLL